MILDRIITHKRKEIAEKKKLVPLNELTTHLARSIYEKRSFKEALETKGISLIAEVKKASPSKGVLRADFDPAQLAVCYETNGAAAVSVLTDHHFFQGGLDHLKMVKEAVQLPVLRKDFIIDPYQIYEAKAYGADAILLIAAVLNKEELASLFRQAQALALDVLVEVHSPWELEAAASLGVEILGINNRDLKTFKTDLRTTLQLAQFVPEQCLLVSESGISTKEGLRELAKVGVDAVLVGEALVTNPDVGLKVRELAGRYNDGLD